MSVADSDPGVDELALQRRKRATGRRWFPPAEPQEAELRVLRDRCLAAVDESGGTFDVEAYLVDRGHSWRTVEAVLAQLRVIWGRPSTVVPLSRVR